MKKMKMRMKMRMRNHRMRMKKMKNSRMKMKNLTLLSSKMTIKILSGSGKYASMTKRLRKTREKNLSLRNKELKSPIRLRIWRTS